MAPADSSLLESFFSPETPIPLTPWTGRPSGPGLYFLDRIEPVPTDVQARITRPEPGVVLFGFDPSGTISEIVLERRFPRRRPLHSFFPAGADIIPPWLREILLRASVVPRLKKDCFPRWPAEPCVEEIRAGVRDAAREAGIAFREAPFWPAGKRFAAVLSHDLDAPEAYRHGTWKEFAEIEESYGFRSSWHFCSEHAREAEPVLAELARRGHEIAWHGPRHDYRIAFRSPEGLKATLKRHESLLAQMDVRGFRSPFYLRTDGLYRGIGGAFRYDSSCRDTAAEFLSPYPREGCCTVFPFFRHGTLVLPVTVPEDYTIRFLAGDDGERIAAVQAAKIEWIKRVGGMALVLTHPVRWLSCTPGGLDAYRRLIESLARDAEVHVTLAREAAERWRERSGRGRI